MSRLQHPNRPHVVPKYPGPAPRKAPEPPKFLLTTEETAAGSMQQLVRVRGAPVRPQGVSEEPVLATLATTTPTRDFISPPHHFPKRVPYQLPPQHQADAKRPTPKGKGRDSTRDVKQTAGAGAGAGAGAVVGIKGSVLGSQNEGVHRSSIVVEETAAQYGTPFPPSSLPRLPAIPRPFVPKPRADYAALPLMHQRSADGKIFGGATRRYVPAEYVPYFDPSTAEYQQQLQQQNQQQQQQDQIQQYYEGGEEQQYYQDQDQYQDQYGVVVAVDAPVGPENPMKQLGGQWCACWDDEAGAVYYYNQASGEATWVLPAEASS